MASDSSFNTTSRFRQRKINLKQHLRIVKSQNLPDNVEDVRGDLLGIVDTGVDKSEEDERHLQAVLSASSSSAISAKPVDAYIPTPQASKKWPEYSQFYTAGWSETESYIRSSATVEDAQGTDYNMDEKDAEFLDQLNADIKDSKQKCSEDEFEMICALFESVVAAKQPYLATDPTQIMSYEEIEPHIYSILDDRRRSLRNPMSLERLLMDSNSRDYASKLSGSPYRSQAASAKTFGSDIYKHWRQRKIESKGHSVFPTLRYETGLASDDSDPYVCFRHREVRHSRKTRRTDQQNSGRIRKLHSEMQSAKSLFELILKRERTRLQQIQSDFEIFELRCRVKALKRKLKIGPEPDDVKLMVSTSKRARQEHQAALRREANEREKRAKAAQEKLERERERRESSRERSGSSVGPVAAATGSAGDRKGSVTTASGSRIPDLDHVTVEQQALEKEMALQRAISDKLQQRKDADKGWVNVTEGSQLPMTNFFRDPLLSPPHTPVDNEYEEAHKSLFSEALRQQGATEKLTDLDYSAIELTNSGNLDWERKREPRLPLPINTLEMAVYDPPEIMTIDSDAEVQKLGEMDFQRDPAVFSVPRDADAQVVCRKRKFGGVEYIDRLLPRKLNTMAKFRQDLASNCQTEDDERLLDRFKFDADYEDDADVLSKLCDDPAKLNNIDPATQNLRFSSMLTAKALELINDAAAQRRRVVQAMHKRQQIQLQQRANAEAQAQRNAQLQAQNNIRMQQAQRAVQRQQQRKQRPVPPVINRNTENDKADGSLIPGGSNGANGASHDTPNGASTAASNANPNAALPNAAGSLPNNAPIGVTPSSSSWAANDKKPASPANGFRKAPNGVTTKPVPAKGNHPANGTNADENQGRLTPQLPKVEAGG